MGKEIENQERKGIVEVKYFSLFSGIGGFELGIEQAYEDIAHEQIRQPDSAGHNSSTKGGSKPQLPTCVGYSETDKYTIQIYQRYFPEHKNYGDITRINADTLPDFDLVVGGFPCQSFSIAGKRGGFDDTRGTLFFDIARIVRAKRPRICFLENVKGLLSHDRGRTFDTILRTLDELGYDLQWQVLNSKNFGVPQNRERVFIVGNFRGTHRPKVFPIRASSQQNDKDGTYAHALNASDWRGANRNQKQTTIQQLNQPKHSNNRIYGQEGISPNLNTMQGGNRQPFISPTIRAEHHNTADVHFIGELPQIRRLTPTECERLQGFPDGWTEGVSDTQRYKTLGNAVTVNVIREIAKKLA
jgi:DNA (cytosine-5)-methyltransferase 1